MTFELERCRNEAHRRGVIDINARELRKQFTTRNAGYFGDRIRPDSIRVVRSLKFTSCSNYRRRPGSDSEQLDTSAETSATLPQWRD